MHFPIHEKRQEIVETVNANMVTIITGETGCGKSTQVPQYLWAEGYKVIVTEPQRPATWNLATWVATELETKLGGVVGYKTGFESKMSKETSILYCTDAIQVVRQLTEKFSEERMVLIIDECHEWNQNIENLVAWAKKCMDDGNRIKLVIMSATLEVDKLSNYFNNAPILYSVGRMYPVTFERDQQDNLVQNIISAVQAGKNTLVFLPGKAEIENTMLDLEGIENVFPLHSALDFEQQQLCFQNYEQPKVILATNIAETSLTIPGIEVVIDTGLERQIEVRNGVEGLYLNHISKANIEQRRGRAGRERAGRYVLCSDYPYEDRNEFPVPEICRKRLDQTVLRLINIGMEPEKLKFFHQPDIEAILDARRILQSIGAITEDGRIINNGKLMCEIPVSVRYARMLIEAFKRGVLDDVITITSIMEVKGIRERNQYYSQYTREESSDLLAELDLFRQVEEKKKNLNTQEESRHLGINMKSYWRACEIRNKLVTLFGREHVTTTRDREQIKAACLSGMLDSVYSGEMWGSGYQNSNDTNVRMVDRFSCVYKTQYIAGLPYDINYKDRWGDNVTCHILKMCTTITPELLCQFPETKVNYHYEDDGFLGVRRHFKTTTYGEIKLIEIIE